MLKLPWVDWGAAGLYTSYLQYADYQNGVGRRMSQLVLLLFVCALATEPVVLLFSTARSLLHGCWPCNIWQRGVCLLTGKSDGRGVLLWKRVRAP